MNIETITVIHISSQTHLKYVLEGNNSVFIGIRKVLFLTAGNNGPDLICRITKKLSVYHSKTASFFIKEI